MLSVSENFLNLPNQPELASALELNIEHAATQVIWQSLIVPAEDLLSRPGKCFRKKLVEIGYRLYSQMPDSKTCEGEIKGCQIASGIVEFIHAGALIIDDIQDGSSIRRNAPSLHLRYGVPKSINVGNWLYFWPLLQIKKLGLPTERELQAYHVCAEALAYAHFGQSLDIGTSIDQVPQEEVSKLCFLSIQLKTGMLIWLSICLGALLAGSSMESLSELRALSLRLGASLQFFDDIGNIHLGRDATQQHSSKENEDLAGMRPTWVWAFAADHLNVKDYQDFVSAVRKLPEQSHLQRWMKSHNFIQALKQKAQEDLHQIIEEFRAQYQNVNQAAVQEFSELAQLLGSSYG